MELIWPSTCGMGGDGSCGGGVSSRDSRMKFLASTPGDSADVAKHRLDRVHRAISGWRAPMAA